jgi:hypothetical protein
VHDVAFVAFHESIDMLPLLTLPGLAEIETTGAGGVTETIADCDALPPAPAQLKLYVVLAAIAPVVPLPCIALLPDHPPDAVQEVAFVEDQDSVDAFPLRIVLGLALIVTVGAGELTDTVATWEALPPAPVQVSV